MRNIVKILLIAFLVIAGLPVNMQVTKAEETPPWLRHKADLPALMNAAVVVPAGEFTMFVEKDGKIETRRIHVDEFMVDQFEINIPEYADCVLRGECNIYPLILTIVNLHRDELIPAGSEREKRFSKLKVAGGDFSRPFWMDIEESELNMEFFSLVLPKAFTSKEPIGYLDFFDAEKFCRSQGARLPTNAEWEKAARGSSDDRRYPWGNDAPTDCTYGNLSGMFDPLPQNCPNGPVDARSTQYPPSPYGVYNMTGNQNEFVIDIYGPMFLDYMEKKNPIGWPKYMSVLPAKDREKTMRIVKGGGYTKNDYPDLEKIFEQKEENIPFVFLFPASISRVISSGGGKPDNGVRCVRSNVEVKGNF